MKKEKKKQTSQKPVLGYEQILHSPYCMCHSSHIKQESAQVQNTRLLFPREWRHATESWVKACSVHHSPSLLHSLLCKSVNLWNTTA